MNKRTYTSVKRYTLANGVVKTCPNKYYYTPVDKTNKVTQKSVVETIRQIHDKETLRKVKIAIDGVLAEGTGQNEDNMPQVEADTEVDEPK